MSKRNLKTVRQFVESMAKGLADCGGRDCEPGGLRMGEMSATFKT